LKSAIDGDEPSGGLPPTGSVEICILGASAQAVATSRLRLVNNIVKPTESFFSLLSLRFGLLIFIAANFNLYESIEAFHYDPFNRTNTDDLPSNPAERRIMRQFCFSINIDIIEKPLN